MLFSNLFKKKVIDERIGSAYITERLPLFHGRAKDTNKTIWVVNEILRDDLAKATHYEHEIDIDTETVDLSEQDFLTQDGIPIKYNKKGILTKFNKDFSKEGYKIGQVYEFENMGYLENITSFDEVICVLDSGVLFREYPSNKYSSIFLNHYSELERIVPKLK